MKAIRNIIFILMLLLITSFGGSEQQSPIYQHLGNFNHNFNTTTNVGLSSYVTKHYNVDKSYGYRYVYYLKMISSSHNNRYLTSTWLYSTRVYVNGNEVTFKQSPNGFTVYIKTTETILYSWYTNDEHMNYSVTWGDAVYDPRNIR